MLVCDIGLFISEDDKYSVITIRYFSERYQQYKYINPNNKGTIIISRYYLSLLKKIRSKHKEEHVFTFLITFRRLLGISGIPTMAVLLVAVE